MSDETWIRGALPVWWSTGNTTMLLLLLILGGLGQAGDSCEAKTDCEGKLRCVSGECRPAGVGAQCKKAAECPSPLRCRANVCVNLEGQAPSMAPPVAQPQPPPAAESDPPAPPPPPPYVATVVEVMVDKPGQSIEKVEVAVGGEQYRCTQAVTYGSPCRLEVQAGQALFSYDGSDQIAHTLKPGTQGVHVRYGSMSAGIALAVVGGLLTLGGLGTVVFIPPQYAIERYGLLVAIGVPVIFAGSVIGLVGSTIAFMRAAAPKSRVDAVVTAESKKLVHPRPVLSLLQGGGYAGFAAEF